VHYRHNSGIVIVTFLLALISACTDESGKVQDEALRADRTAASFPHAGEDYFHAMDGGLTLSPEEVKGRNMWLVWSGGNDRFWNQLTQYTFGSFDLLKVISSHPSLGYSRANRWEYLGVVNEPCFRAPTGPNKDRRGLWLDVRTSDCPADPFEDEKRYPGVANGSRGKSLGDGTTQPVGSYYGYPTGVLGLRLFPNPDFDAKAAKQWDPERYYTDSTYYNRKDLVRPYRVGMACGFCHVGPSPIRPPADPDAPAYANLSSSVGAQYLWVDRLFVFDANKSTGQKNFLVQVLKTSRPGTLDTSLVSTDNINNPRTMNALYNVVARMGLGDRLWHEHLSGGELDNKQFNDYSAHGPLTELYDRRTAVVHTPHVLKDGADSVGVLGALNRVYLNIGLFSEEWLTHFNPLVGGKLITPMPIAVAEKNSVYWQATESGTPNMAAFFRKAAQPDRLRDAPDGNRYLTSDAKTLARGKEVFADVCARCHSSKLPEPPAELNLDADRCAGAAYLECFRHYWAWTQTPAFKQQMRAIVMRPDFLEGNYLSTDARIPVTLLRTNICSPLATNAIAGNVWDNFSSQSYKQLPSVGTVTVYDPFTGDRVPYEMPVGGRGYTRVPSLVSIWSTAPFLLNNTVGPFDPDPSVATRMKVFQASIEQLLWPEKRTQDPILGAKIPGLIDRTTEQSQVSIPAGFVPGPLRSVEKSAHAWLPRLIDRGGDIELGPIPAGMPVGLLANLQLRSESDNPAVQAQHLLKLSKALLTLKADLITSSGASEEELGRRLSNLGRPLWQLSKCPDLVVNRGHYFGTAAFNDQQKLTADERAFGTEPELDDADKNALIEFLKTF
jgi:hypothetical protein